MKPFITDLDLQRLQQTRGKYLHMYQVDIFLDLPDLDDDFNYLDFARCLFHRLIDVENNIWEIKFSDGSYCLLKIDKKGTYAKGFPPFNHHDVNYYFNDVPN